MQTSLNTLARGSARENEMMDCNVEPGTRLVQPQAARYTNALTHLAASLPRLARRLAPGLCLFAALTSPPALRAQDLDTTFANPNFNGQVNALAVDGIGRIVVGGAFTNAGIGNISIPYWRLARLNLNGTLDTTFINPYLRAFNYPAEVNALAVGSGKILAGGTFYYASSVDSRSQASFFAQFKYDGFRDLTETIDPFFDAPVSALAVDGSGRYIVGGLFASAGVLSSTYRSLARLSPHGPQAGAWDPSFADPSLNGQVNALAVDGSGKYVVGGAFTIAGSGHSTYGRLARFNPDGTLDTTFSDPNLNGQVNALVLDGSGKIVVGGAFTTAGSGNSTYARLARFNPDGTLDTTFADPNLNAQVKALAVDGSGKILVGGAFTTAGSGNSTYGRLARFNPNGTLDTVFVNPNLNAQVNALVLDGSGKIVVGGAFTTAGIGNSNYAGVARFNTNTPVIISAQPQTQSAAATSNVTFSVTASGGTGLTYQWQFNGTNIVGATSPTFSLANISATNGGAYRVVVSNNTGGTTTSQAANLLLFGDLRFLAVSALSGTVGQQFRVDYADVLNSVTNWLPLTTVTLPFSPFFVVDPDSPGRTNRYYRAVSLP